MCGWFFNFAPNYASNVQPMTHLLSKDVPFEWTQDVDHAFRKIKQQISSLSALKPFDPQFTIFVTTDASDKGIGVILSQKDEAGRERLVSFWSRKFTLSKENTLLRKRRPWQL